MASLPFKRWRLPEHVVIPFVHVRTRKCSYFPHTFCPCPFSLEIAVRMINSGFSQGPDCILNPIHWRCFPCLQPVAVVVMQEPVVSPGWHVPAPFPNTFVPSSSLIATDSPVCLIFLWVAVRFICLRLFWECWHNEKFIILCRKGNGFC